MAKRILAFSSSRAGGGAYLEQAAPVIHRFLGNKALRIAFVPFASVDDYGDYAANVRAALSALPHTVNLVEPQRAKAIVEEADAIMIGGGNTFKLLHDLYALDLVKSIRQKVEDGVPYIGWSAGSNLVGPTIRTTNDMPIVQPESFAAFGFFPFQINPHYRNEVQEGFHGETRDQRLEEFLKLNTGKQIVALPEGTYLQLQNNQLLFDGIAQGVVMTREEGQTVHRIVHPGTVMKF